MRVTEGQVRHAMCCYDSATHNLAEGAGALALAAAIAERGRERPRVGVVLSGENVDWPVFESAFADP